MDKKKSKNKPTIPSAAEEGKEAMEENKEEVIPKKPITPDTIFFADRIDKLYNAKDPIESINVLLQDHFRKINGNANFDEEKLRAEAEFHVNNLVFLKQTFSFDNEAISSLMNVLGKLIKFKNINQQNYQKVVQTNESQVTVGSVDISGNQLPEEVSNVNNNKNVSPTKDDNENNQKDNNNNENNENNPDNKNNPQEENKEKEENQNNENVENNDNEKNIEQEKVGEENNNFEDVDFLFLSKEKLNEFKESLIEENLMPKTKSEFLLANNKDKTRTKGKFFLNLKEINEILKYIQTNYLPYIRMWYYFQNDQRLVTERKIEVIINTPTLIDMPLSMATQEKTDEEKAAEEEEERKKKLEEEKRIEEENKKKEEEELKKQEESKKLLEEQNKEETYLDLLERLGLNEETKKIIIEKIEELHKEVDGKIDNRKKTLDDKIREIDESVHGKKK